MHFNSIRKHQIGFNRWVRYQILWRKKILNQFWLLLKFRLLAQAIMMTGSDLCSSTKLWEAQELTSQVIYREFYDQVTFYKKFTKSDFQDDFLNIRKRFCLLIWPSSIVLCPKELSISLFYINQFFSAQCRFQSIVKFIMCIENST